MASAHELVLDLEPDVSREDGRRYRASVVARATADGHWKAWLQFVDDRSHEVLTTGIETHQATDADLHNWATTLGDVYLRGALARTSASPDETCAHRRALAQTADTGVRGRPAAPKPFELFALGEHVLHRELQLYRRATLLALIINDDLNPRGLDISRFTKAQLIAFIVTAIEVQTARAQAPRPAAAPSR